MDSLNTLHVLLSDYVSSHNGDIQDLYYELVSHKSRLRSLFDLGPRNEAERKELQAGESSTATFLNMQMPIMIRKS